MGNPKLQANSNKRYTPTRTGRTDSLPLSSPNMEQIDFNFFL